MRASWLLAFLTLGVLLSLPPRVACGDDDSTIPDLTPQDVRETHHDLADNGGADEITHKGIDELLKEPDYEELRVNPNDNYEDAADQTHRIVEQGKEDAAKDTHSDVMKEAPTNTTGDVPVLNQ